MTGGSLNLSSTRGAGTDIINVNPQITFFKKVFKRHTNFGIETIEQSVSIDFGQTREINIDKVGSLVSNMHFEFTLPPASGDDGETVNGTSLNSNRVGNDIGCVNDFKGYCRWVNAVGYAIVNEIQLRIGNNIVDKHTGLWLDIWNELTDPNRKEWPLVGKYDDTERENKSEFNYSRYYVPLKFYFNRDIGLSIPYFLLNENDLKITLSLNSLASLLLFDKKVDNSTAIQDRSLSAFKFFVDYVFLEPEEETKIAANLPSEYLVESIDIKDNITAASSSNLVFENPTKEFIWVFRQKERIAVGNANTNVPKYNPPGAGTNNNNPNDIFNYSRLSLNSDLSYGSYDPFSTLVIRIDNQDRFDQTDATFFRTLQPYKHHSNIPGGINKNSKKQYIYAYSFAINPEQYQPSGSYNFSINDESVTFQFTGPSDLSDTTDGYVLTIFSIRYEYISFNRNNVSISNVPIQSALDRALDTTSGETSEAQQVAVQYAATSSDKKKKAVKQEIKRRYAVEVPYVHDKSLGKKKWSGLQGDFFREQRYDDLEKEYEKKKKIIN